MKLLQPSLGRPFGRTGGLLFYPRCFLFSFFQRVISEVPWAMTAKLRHMIGTCVNFYRAMHFSAFARSWDRMSSVRPSVRLAVRL